jgi:polyisoprenoid-binding protein YceI
MKNLSMNIVAAFMLIMVAFTSVKTENFKIDKQKSLIEWTGKKVLGSHNGEIKLASGTLTTENKVPVRGNFIIDMSSLTNKDLTDTETKGKLLGHLKSEDFFSVEKFPTAQFTATRITAGSANQVNITGNLTIKGITNAITFPATYKVNGNTFIAKAENVKVDRTKFNIKYGSKSFFESIGDKAIDDEFVLNINIVANK